MEKKNHLCFSLIVFKILWSLNDWYKICRKKFVRGSEKGCIMNWLY